MGAAALLLDELDELDELGEEDVPALTPAFTPGAVTLTFAPDPDVPALTFVPPAPTLTLVLGSGGTLT